MAYFNGRSMRLVISVSVLCLAVIVLPGVLSQKGKAFRDLIQTIVTGNI